MHRAGGERWNARHWRIFTSKNILLKPEVFFKKEARYPRLVQIKHVYKLKAISTPCVLRRLSLKSNGILSSTWARDNMVQSTHGEHMTVLPGAIQVFLDPAPG